MRHGTLVGLALAALLVALGTAPAAASIDLSGEYVISVPIPCTVTLVQTGTALELSGSCSVGSTTYPFHLAGTVDPGTGAFSITGAIPGLCADYACSGTGDGEEAQITCTSSTDVCNGPLMATKCGNGLIDALENCEDGNLTDGDCCSARCRAETHPCDDGDACTIGDVCAGGSCASGARALAGQACEGEVDDDPCTADFCDAAGACTAHVPMSPAECRRTVRKRDVARCMATQCEGVGRKACRRRCKPAAIGTLAYVLSECREDAGQSFVGRQELRIRQGDREPITVATLGPSNPTPDPLGLCRAYSESGFGSESVVMFPLQRLGVSPDGSAVVFEVNDQSPFFRPISVSPEENGFFLVRADGSQPPRRLGPPSRDPSFRVADPLVLDDGLGNIYTLSPPIAFSPNGRLIAFTDVGPGPDGTDAVQIVVLDLGADPPKRTQLTQLSSGTSPATFPGGSPLFVTCCPRFIDDRTVGFQTYTDPDGSNPERQFAAFTVGIDGRGLKPVPKPAVPADSHVVPSFGVVGPGSNLLRVAEGPGAFPVTEIFLQAGKDLLQLTQFGRPDTFAGFVDPRRSRAFFLASAEADPLIKNPNGTCQIFSMDTLGGVPRQVTRFDLGVPFLRGCFRGGGAIGYGAYRVTDQDALTNAIIFNTALDPLHLGAPPAHPEPTGYDDDQIFAIRPDGTGLRQLTDAAGFTSKADGSIRVELPGPFAYPAAPR